MALAKNILLSNDDSWAATNIRAFYRDLKAAGHTVILVAPASQRSGWSGKFDVPYTKELLTDAEFAYRVKGDPAWGHEPDDIGIWYFNGTPASCVSFGLEYVIPKYFGNLTIDLVVSGPNEGLNLGPGTYTISGTIGSIYNAVYQGYPAIAISGSNGNNSFFKDGLNDDPINPANINANKSVEIVNQILQAQGENQRALPLGVGLNVNIPKVGSQSDDECTNPNFVYTRLAGIDADVAYVYYNETTGLVSSKYRYTDALTVCNSGDCTLPSESLVVDDGCSITISTFQIDYDANAALQNEVKGLLQGIL